MEYDYVFAGCGLSTLVVLNEMFEAEMLFGKKILILEPNDIYSVEKTWCFWENEKESSWGKFVSKEWFSAKFIDGSEFIETMPNDVSYKMISSNEFITSMLKKVNSCNNILIVKEHFVSFFETGKEVVVETNLRKYRSNYFFSSVSLNDDFNNSSKYPLLKQHFVGWFIKTKQPLIDDSCVTFMDFSVDQLQNTRFMYVLPFSKHEALFEFTLFSKNLLEEVTYETEIKKYLKRNNIEEYTIVKKEKGNIPMTVYPFWKANGKRVLFIGTAGGWTKASTGYTFKKSSRKAKELVFFLKSGKDDFRKFHKWNKFDFYDSLFVKVLFDNNKIGKLIFTNMFRKVDPLLILKFLDEKTTFYEDLKIIRSCPKKPFLRALFKNFI